MTGLHLDMLIEHFELEMREVDEFSFFEARVYGGFFRPVCDTMPCYFLPAFDPLDVVK